MRQYPRDPRAHLFQAMALVQARNLQGAEQQMRLALSEPDIFTLLVPTAKPRLQSYLALILTDLRRREEAKQFATAGCRDNSAGMHAALVKAGLCELPKS
ncbi:hypothetical protein [Bradyrhizobium sp. AZCC 2289]|uniref:hypothetical protein n=1 Tax=Bradyrhizobium sp. AZCC 2289 TaxID=3117026 RepID=UPI002FF05E9A